MRRLTFAVGVFALACIGMTIRADANDVPFVLGTLDGMPADVILLNGGGSGGAFSARVFAFDGAQGVVDLGTVDAVGGDGLGAFFSDGALFFTNSAPLPGECHACATHIAVQRCHLRNHKLVIDGKVTIDTPSTQSPSTFRSELEKRAIDAFRKRST